MQFITSRQGSFWYRNMGNTIVVEPETSHAPVRYRVFRKTFPNSLQQPPISPARGRATHPRKTSQCTVTLIRTALKWRGRGHQILNILGSKTFFWEHHVGVKEENVSSKVVVFRYFRCWMTNLFHTYPSHNLLHGSIHCHVF